MHPSSAQLIVILRGTTDAPVSASPRTCVMRCEVSESESISAWVLCERLVYGWLEYKLNGFEAYSLVAQPQKWGSQRRFNETRIPFSPSVAPPCWIVFAYCSIAVSGEAFRISFRADAMSPCLSAASDD